MKKLVTLIGLLSSLNLMSIDRAQAGLLALPTLTQAQMAPIFETMAAALSYRAVEPASSAKWWALGIGVRLTLINATSIASVVGSPIPIPAADISAVVQLPLGLGVELGYLPPLTLFAGTSIQLIGGNVKWTFTNIISDNFPIDICVRAMYTNASFSYTQAVSGVNTSVGYGANMYGGSVGVSKTLLFFTPYFNYGVVNHQSSLSSSASLFNGFPVGTSTVTGTSTAYDSLSLGVAIKLAIVVINVEGDYMFGNLGGSAKVGFKF